MDPIETLQEMQEERTQAWQEWMLGRLVEPAFVRKNQNVKGEYTTGEFVIWLLNRIFGPANWGHTVLKGPELIHVNESLAYSQVTVRLTVRFANGSEVVHDDIGIWPFVATDSKRGGTLDNTSPERFEQVIKSAVTDGLKACTDYLGNCFRPIADAELVGYLGRRQARADLEIKRAAGQQPPQEKSAEEDTNDLFGEEPEEPQPDPVIQAAESMGGKVVQELPENTAPRTMTELYEWAEKAGVAKDDAIQRIIKGTDLKSVKEAVDTGWKPWEIWTKFFVDAKVVPPAA